MSAPLQPSTPESEHQQGTLADPPTQAESLFTEEGLDQEQYAAERRQGHVVIQVQTSKTEDVERAHGVLVAMMRIRSNGSARGHARICPHRGESRQRKIGVVANYYTTTPLIINLGRLLAVA